MIVVDASAVCELLLRGPAERRLAALMLADGASLHAPDLILVEVVHVMRRHARTGVLSDQRANEMRQDLADLPIHCYPSRPLLDRVWALRDNLTAFDAVYVALAEALDATLITTDPALARAAGIGSTVVVEVPAA